MTILEHFTLEAIKAIIEEKRAANNYPLHALIIHDNLAQRVEDIMGVDIQPFEVKSALSTLERAKYIKMGNTINDTYILTTENE